MTVCKKCNKQLPDGALFCDNCGEKIQQLPENPDQDSIVCEKCGNVQSKNSVFCTNCGNRISIPDQAPAEATVPAGSVMPPVKVEVPAEAPAEDNPAKSKKGKSAVIFAIVAAIILGVVFYSCPGLFGSEKKVNGFLYIKDNELYISDVSGKTPIELTSNFMKGNRADAKDIFDDINFFITPKVKMTSDGKSVFYPDKVDFDQESFSLYYRKSISQNSEPLLIAADVSDYLISDSGKMVVFRDSENNLYFHNLKERSKIDNDVNNYYISKDGKTVVYTNNDFKLYSVSYGKEKHKIDSDYSYLYEVTDTDDFYYMKEDKLYRYSHGDKTKIDSKVGFAFTDVKDGIYYTKQSKSNISAWDFIEDDLKEHDRSLTEPTRPEFPDDNDYWSISGGWDIDGYSKAYDKYYEDLDKYYDLLDDYSDKEDRDDLREELDDYTFENGVCSLHYFDGKKSHKVSDGFINNYTAVSSDHAPMIAFFKLDGAPSEKAKFSELYSDSDVSSWLDSQIEDSGSLYIANKEKAYKVDCKNPNPASLRFAEDALYFVADVKDDRTGNAYSVKIGKNEISDPERIDTGVYSSWDYYSEKLGYIYFKDVKISVGSMYIDGERIDKDVDIYNVLIDGSNIAYTTDFDSDKGYGTLKYYSKGKTTEVTDDVSAIRFVNGKLVYICDVSRKNDEGEIYIFDGKKSKKVDDDAIGLILPSN